MQLLKLLKKYASDRRGNFAITTAVMAPALFGAVGLAFDFSIYSSQRSSMQEAADQAVVAATREAAVQGWSQGVAKSVVENFVHETLNAAAMTSTVYTTDVQVDEKNKRVKLTLQQDGHGYLLLGFVKRNPQIEVVSEAALANSTSVCVLTLNETDGSTLKIAKKSTIAAENCGVFANSSDPEAIEIEAGAALSASTICSSGGWDGRKMDVDPEPVTDCPILADPLAGRAPPKVGGCNYHDTDIAESTMLNPGVYCGGIKVGGDAVVKFVPGVYVIRDGEFSVTGNASVIGKNVGFYLTGSTAKVGFENSTQVNLTAPKAGPLAGILFFEDRNSPKGREFQISSKDAEVLIGTIYLPKGYLLVRGKTNFAEDSDWTAIITQEIRVENGPQITLHSDYAGSDIPVPEGVAGQSRRIFLTQ